MEFNQRKLTKQEWESTEVPVSLQEQEILRMILAGFHDLNIAFNGNQSLMGFMKITYTPLLENYLYNTYFKTHITKLVQKYNIQSQVESNTPYNTELPKQEKSTLKKSDMIRVEANSQDTINKKSNELYEFILLDIVGNFLKHHSKENERQTYYYYTLVHIISAHIPNTNKHVMIFVNHVIESYRSHVSISKLVTSANQYIENNPYLLKFDNIKLYNHQKRLFQIFPSNKHNTSPTSNTSNTLTTKKEPSSKLVLYIAPTATGKTMSPLGLSEQYRVIFVCAARHVGLALAKSAVSVEKKVAFAFGCECTEDIRLHYYSSSSFVRNESTGQYIKYKNGMRKTDHSVGDKVEIMICDIQSYEYAMYYMLAHNDKQNIITFWDEPTIGLDYETHDNHNLIQKVWSVNLIPNVILSSATLPKQEELHHVIRDFHMRFENGSILTVNSNDCKKTIPLIDSSGKKVMPHMMITNMSELRAIVSHCQDYTTLMRYMDLHEIGKFVKFAHKKRMINSEPLTMTEYFTSVKDVSMIKLKTYYLEILQQLTEVQVTEMKEYFEENEEFYIGYDNVEENSQTNQTNKNAGMFITTKDAYTLTDGPTIFITKSPTTIGKFCVQQSNIPASTLDGLMETITFNTKIGKKVEKLEKSIEDKMTRNETNKDDGKSEKGSKQKESNEVKQLERELEALTSLLKTVKLDSKFMPNTLHHLNKWIVSETLRKSIDKSPSQPFKATIEESHVKSIMELANVEPLWKLLLIMGIGMFSKDVAPEYLEIMKTLAEKQHLYLIIASDDYIYGTNYQFCHGYVSKDLSNMTQEKLIQALGRVGRNNIQQNYSIRFRCPLYKKLFVKEEDKIEAVNMNRLFVSM